MEFSRPEYWSRLQFPSPGARPNPVIEPRSPWVLQEPCFPGKNLQADSLPLKPQLLLLYSERLQHLVAKLSDKLISS